MTHAKQHIEHILEQYNSYIETLARNRIPRSFFPPEVVAMEIDELAQRVRIKLWSILLRRKINNLKAYIRVMVASEAIDMMRRTLGIDIDEVRWPEEKDDKQRLRASLVVARKKLRDLLECYIIEDKGVDDSTR